MWGGACEVALARVRGALTRVRRLAAVGALALARVRRLVWAVGPARVLALEVSRVRALALPVLGLVLVL